MPEETAASARRTTAALALGAAVGIAMAVASLMQVRGSGASLPEGIAAEVNGVPIRTVDYLRAVNALASDRRSPLTAADRRHVLDRLIDEELLVQYGVDLGLLRSDRRVRGDLVAAVLAAQVASVDGYEPTPDEIASFYEHNADFFATPGRLRLSVIWVRGEPARSGEEALARARQAVAALEAGEDFEAVRQRLGDAPIAPLPDTYLPPAKVREYVGPTVTNAVLALEPGEVSEPIRSGNGVYVVRVVDREPPGAPPLESVEKQVVAEMKRRAGDDAVVSTLERLREEGDVTSLEELP
jgi:parvulin-like peptidyl-prolyl isomerase